jgi:hypothetical protein
LRQFDYAFFDNLVYGHAPGEIFGHEGIWLWFRRGLVDLDNPQMNYLTAHDGKSFHLILTSQSREQETVRVRFYPEQISPLKGEFATATVTSEGGRKITLDDRAVTMELPPRGLVTLRVDGLKIEVPTHRRPPAPGEWKAPGFVKVETADAPAFRAASLQAIPNSWDAYVWSTALPAELQSFAVEWSAGGKSGFVEDTDGYPFELMIPVEAVTDSLEFRVLGVRPDGKSFITNPHAIGVAR